MVGIFSSARSWRSTIACTALLALIAACGGSPPVTPGASSGNGPTVVVQSPANGAVVGLGQDVTVAGAASDTVGVDHVALFADGVSVASTPSAAPAPTVPFTLTWLATPAGPHVLQVIAYRADGTPSDPAVVNIVVGASGSGLGGSSLFSFPVASAPGGLITPSPTKKPKPSKNPATATPAPTDSSSTTPTASPTATPTPTPTPTPAGSPVLTPDPNGQAPDDSALEPHQIEFTGDPTACPLSPHPANAVGCIWERVSSPGDGQDTLYFVPTANVSYEVIMSACDGQTDSTTWMLQGQDPSLKTGCGNWLITTTGPTPPASITIAVSIGQPSGPAYDLYLYAVYACALPNCADQ